MAQSASAAQLESLYNEFSLRLNRFVMGRVYDKAMAEDIVQDVFAALAAENIDEIDNVSGWLYRVARNTIIDHHRSAARRRELPTELTQLPESPVEGDDDHAIWDEIVTCLQPFLDGLAPAHREALEMTDLGGITQADAAQRVGISVAGMKSRVQRARSELLHDLQDCCAITRDGRGRPIEWKSRD